MSIEQNKALASRFGQVWGRESLNTVDELAALDIRVHYPALGEPLHGPQAVKQVLRAWHSAFPDSDRTDQDVIAEQDRVVIAWTVRATHRGELWGVPPTGRAAAIKGISIYRIAGGKIVDERGVGDALGLMQQLGAIPAEPRLRGLGATSPSPTPSWPSSCAEAARRCC